MSGWYTTNTTLTKPSTAIGMNCILIAGGGVNSSTAGGYGAYLETYIPINNTINTVFVNIGGLSSASSITLNTNVFQNLVAIAGAGGGGGTSTYYGRGNGGNGGYLTQSKISGISGLIYTSTGYLAPGYGGGSASNGSATSGGSGTNGSSVFPPGWLDLGAGIGGDGGGGGYGGGGGGGGGHTWGNGGSGGTGGISGASGNNGANSDFNGGGGGYGISTNGSGGFGYGGNGGSGFCGGGGGGEGDDYGCGGGGSSFSIYPAIFIAPNNSKNPSTYGYPNNYGAIYVSWVFAVQSPLLTSISIPNQAKSLYVSVAGGGGMNFSSNGGSGLQINASFSLNTVSNIWIKTGNIGQSSSIMLNGNSIINSIIIAGAGGSGSSPSSTYRGGDASINGNVLVTGTPLGSGYLFYGNSGRNLVSGNNISGGTGGTGAGGFGGGAGLGGGGGGGALVGSLGGTGGTLSGNGSIGLGTSGTSFGGNFGLGISFGGLGGLGRDTNGIIGKGGDGFCGGGSGGLDDSTGSGYGPGGGGSSFISGNIQSFTVTLANNPGQTGSITYSFNYLYTPGKYDISIPYGIAFANVILGAGGGLNNGSFFGGNGANIVAYNIPLIYGSTLSLTVGDKGQSSKLSANIYGVNQLIAIAGGGGDAGQNSNGGDGGYSSLNGNLISTSQYGSGYMSPGFGGFGATNGNIISGGIGSFGGGGGGYGGGGGFNGLPGLYGNSGSSQNYVSVYGGFGSNSIAYSYDGRTIIGSGNVLLEHTSSIEINTNNNITVTDGKDLLESTATLSQARSGCVSATVGNVLLIMGGHTGSAISNVVDIYNIDTNTWSVGPTMPTPRVKFAATCIGNLIIVAGGVSNTAMNSFVPSIDIYNYITNTWSTSSTTVTGRQSLAATTAGNYAIFAGGNNGSDSAVINIYNIVTNTWSTATLSVARRELNATSVKHLAIFVGGVDSQASKRVDIFNSNTGIWTSGDWLSIARSSLAATSVNNLALFASGTSVDIYNADTNTWTTTNLPSNISRANMYAGSLGDYAIFACGSLNWPNILKTNIVDIYNCNTQKWSTMTLPTVRFNSYMNYGQCTIGNKMIIAGGAINGVGGELHNIGTSTFTNNVDIITLTNLTGNNLITFGGAGLFNTVLQIPSSSYARYQGAATSVGNVALFIGGYHLPLSTAVSNVDIYNVDTNTLTLKNLPEARSGHVATSIGNVAIIHGGRNVNLTTFLTNVVMYNYITDTFTSSTPGITGRYCHACTSVGNLAIFAGGYTSTNSAEVNMYNIQTNTWTNTTLPGGARHKLCATSVGNIALFAGGWTSTAVTTVDIYNWQTNTWSIQNLSLARCNIGATSVGNVALFAGGYLVNGTVTSRVDIYNWQSNTWTTANLSIARICFNATSVGDYAIFAGGTSADTVYHTRVDIYNWRTNKWITTELSAPRIPDTYNNSTSIHATSIKNKALFFSGINNSTSSTVHTMSPSIDVFTLYNMSYTNNFNNWNIIDNDLFNDCKSISVNPAGNLWLSGGTNRNTLSFGPSIGVLSIARSWPAATSVGDIAIFAGGDNGSNFDTVNIYNYITNTWSIGPTLSTGRTAMFGTSIGNIAIFAGGESFSNKIDIYNSQTNTINSSLILSQARSRYGVASIGNIAIFAGGLSISGASNVVDIYNATNNSMTVGTALAQARCWLAATSIGNVAIFAGGSINASIQSSTVYSDVDIYNIQTNSWTRLPNGLSIARSALTATSVGNLAIFAGGFTSSTYSNRVDIYNWQSNTWSTASLSQPRSGLASTNIGNYAIFAGGWNGTYLNTVDIYNWETNTWSTSILRQPRAYIGATTVGNLAVFAGGYNGSTSVNTIDTFISQHNTLAYSSNGLNWTPIYVNLFNRGCNSVHVNSFGNLWLAGGSGTDNTLAYSLNGTSNWIGLGITTFSSSCNNTMYDSINNRWFAVGSGGNTIVYSNNGINGWTSVTNQVFSQCNSIAVNQYGNLYVAGGTGGNSLAYSLTGTGNWIGLGSSIFSSCTGISYNPLLFTWTATGLGGNTIAYSTDGINWRNRSNTTFTDGLTSVTGSIISTSQANGISFNGNGGPGMNSLCGNGGDGFSGGGGGMMLIDYNGTTITSTTYYGGGGGSSYSLYPATFSSANNRNSIGLASIEFNYPTFANVTLSSSSDWNSYINNNNYNNYILQSDIIFNRSFNGQINLNQYSYFDGQYNTIFINNINQFASLLNTLALNNTINIKNLRIIVYNTNLKDGCGYLLPGSNNGNISSSAIIDDCKINFTNSLLGNGSGVMVGSSAKYITINNSFVRGNINAINSGGFIGNSSGTNGNININNSYIIGTVSNPTAGGFIGNNSNINSINNSYFIGTHVNNNSIKPNNTSITTQNNVTTYNKIFDYNI